MSSTEAEIIAVDDATRLLFTVAETTLAQSSTPPAADESEITAINEQVWIPFCESYARNDAEAFLALHTADAVRVTSNPRDMKTGEAFRAHTTAQMQYMEAAKLTFTLTLRFTQRIHDDNAALEEGVRR